MKNTRRLKIILLAVTLTALLSQCAVIDKIRGKKAEDREPAELMSDGIENMNRGRYKAAGADFQEIKDRYPYSKYAVQAELKMADAFYIQEAYDLAFDAYAEFEKLHPKNKEIPYVIFRRGLCQFDQVKSFDRDQSRMLRAKEEFERLIRLFPKDSYSNRAQQYLRECLVSLSKYELYVGHFYFAKSKYQAALDRYLYLVNTYPDMGQHQEALEYIAFCRQKISEE
ncbi:MAG: outer membrane protein assembly factor BamD [Desulfobacteraceae bacterium]|nr:MAG: outer membrane protein assembly factor BamD [Desulfobacteraceae bacterium]